MLMYSDAGAVGTLEMVYKRSTFGRTLLRRTAAGLRLIMHNVPLNVQKSVSTQFIPSVHLNR